MPHTSADQPLVDVRTSTRTALAIIAEGLPADQLTTRELNTLIADPHYFADVNAMTELHDRALVMHDAVTSVGREQTGDRRTVTPADASRRQFFDAIYAQHDSRKEITAAVAVLLDHGIDTAEKFERLVAPRRIAGTR